MAPYNFEALHYINAIRWNLRLVLCTSYTLVSVRRLVAGWLWYFKTINKSSGYK